METLNVLRAVFRANADADDVNHAGTSATAAFIAAIDGYGPIQTVLYPCDDGMSANPVAHSTAQ